MVWTWTLPRRRLIDVQARGQSSTESIMALWISKESRRIALMHYVKLENPLIPTYVDFAVDIFDLYGVLSRETDMEGRLLMTASDIARMQNIHTGKYSRLFIPTQHTWPLEFLVYGYQPFTWAERQPVSRQIKDGFLEAFSGVREIVVPVDIYTCFCLSIEDTGGVWWTRHGDIRKALTTSVNNSWEEVCRAMTQKKVVANSKWLTWRFPKIYLELSDTVVSKYRQNLEFEEDIIEAAKGEELAMELCRDTLSRRREIIQRYVRVLQDMDF